MTHAYREYHARIYRPDLLPRPGEVNYAYRLELADEDLRVAMRGYLAGLLHLDPLSPVVMDKLEARLAERVGPAWYKAEGVEGVCGLLDELE